MTADLDMPQFTGRALCAEVDPELWFPDKGGSSRAAKNVCLSCEIRDECLTYALDHDERFGIWGGLSERERRRLKRQPPTEEAAPTTVAPVEQPVEAAPTGPRRTRPWRDDELAQAINELRGYGMTYGEMATHLGTSITRVRAAHRRAAA